MLAPRVRIADAARPALALALCAALLWAPVALAASKNLLYKCVDAAGVVSIQSVACPAGSTTVWKRDATPEPALTPEQVVQQDAKTLRDQQAVREQLEIADRKLNPVAPPPIEESKAPAPGDAPPPAEGAASQSSEVDPCVTAQMFVGSVREKAWLALNEEQLRNLYNWAAEQCKGSPSAR